MRGNADAVIVSSFAITPAEIRRLNTTRIPLIGINTASQGFTASVGIDDKAGIRLIVRHLTTLGHRNLLYLYETFDARWASARTTASPDSWRRAANWTA